MSHLNVIHNQDCLAGLKELPDNSVDCCVTSPPYYGLRDYGVEGQLGLESSPDEYVARMVEVFSEVRRVLKPDGTLWLNIGDSYCATGTGSGDQKSSTLQGSKSTQIEAGKRPHKRPGNGIKPKDLIGIPWMLAFALRSPDFICHGCGTTSHSDTWGRWPNGRRICPKCELSKGHDIIPGWYLRQDIIWAKNNCMPESVTDRCTKSHEYIFLFSKSQKYHFDSKAIAEPIAGATVNDRVDTGKVRKNNGFPGSQSAGHGRLGELDMRNKRSVWSISPAQFHEAHFATFPEEIPAQCIKAGCPIDGIVLDPFMGAGTTAIVARKLNRNFIGLELNPKYIEIANKRMRNELGMFSPV